MAEDQISQIQKIFIRTKVEQRHKSTFNIFTDKEASLFSYNRKMG
jgi:hypothetical protein